VELLARFLIGGAAVTLFAAMGDILRPKSFAGLFGAAPSVATASLALTLLQRGSNYAATEARSMIIGAAAFVLITWACSYVLLRSQQRAWFVTSAAVAVWLLLTWAGWALFIRAASA
jgi:Protein of unknown function (DUF3147)